jgi:hypothetical protein
MQYVNGFERSVKVLRFLRTKRRGFDQFCQVGAITLAVVKHYLPCLCYQTLTLHSFVPYLTFTFTLPDQVGEKVCKKSLESMMIAPVQRLPVYLILLETLEADTPMNDPGML